MAGDDHTTESQRRSAVKALRVLAAVLAVAALVKELRVPAAERTWHGTLAGFIPYDFRRPTWNRVRATFWDPEGSIIVGRVFGVGWTINAGAAVARARSLFAS